MGEQLDASNPACVGLSSSNPVLGEHREQLGGCGSGGSGGSGGGGGGGGLGRRR